MGFMVLTLGAGIDFSHLYLVRGELQAVADEAVQAAAGRLDGTDEGVAAARKTANRLLGEGQKPEWLAFSAERLATPSVEFASQPAGPWQDSPSDARRARAVRVTSRAEARLFFLPMVPNMPSVQRVTASAVAGQAPGAPERRADREFAIQAEDETGALFGFRESGVYPLSGPVEEECRGELRRRWLEDTDGASENYEGYVRMGNGRRFLIVPIRGNGGKPLGHGAFLVPPQDRASGKCEAIFLGASPLAGFRRLAPGPPGFYEVRLYP